VEAVISIPDPGAGVDLYGAREWLSREPEFRGRLRLVNAQPSPDEMGTLIDVLSVSLSGGGALTVLAGSLTVWLQQKRSTLSVRLTASDGTSMEISAAGPSADKLADRMTRSEQPGDAPS
jgi:Effector Associated Constant Component 1